MAGDEASYPPGLGQAHGHTGLIVSDQQGGLTNISSHAHGVYRVPAQFENRLDTVYLAYIGE